MRVRRDGTTRRAGTVLRLVGIGAVSALLVAGGAIVADTITTPSPDISTCRAVVEAYDALHTAARESVDGLAAAAARGKNPARIAATLDGLATRLDMPGLADLRDECLAVDP